MRSQKMCEFSDEDFFLQTILILRKLMESREITVVQLLPELNEGGVERGVVELNREFVLNGMSSHVISKGGRLEKQIQIDGGCHHTLNICDKNPFTFPLRVQQLRKLIKSLNPDIIHSRSRYPAWVAWFANKSLGIPFVTTVHGMNSINFYSRIMTKGDKVICVSEVIRKYICKAYSISPENMVVIQRGADMQLFNPNELNYDFIHNFKKRFGLDDRFVVTSVGRITWLKDYESLIKAISICRSKIPNLTGLIVGGVRHDKTEYFESLKQLVKDKGLQDCVHFVGNQKNVAEIYELSDIVVNASLKMGNVGRTVIEALAMNTPVLATSFKDLDNIIKDGENGYILKTQDVGDLCEKIILLKQNPINNTRSTIPINFTLDAMVRDTIMTYKSLIESSLRKLGE